MSNPVRQLTETGNAAFLAYLESLKETPNAPPPFALLNDAQASTAVPFTATIEQHPGGEQFASRHAFGTYLVDVLGAADRRAISFNHGLWNWLALYFFDQLCPADGSGNRDRGEVARYFLTKEYRHDRYYRHLVRSPWLAVGMHPVTSRVILIPLSSKGAPLEVVGEIFSQVAARQGVFRSPAVMAAIDEMYFDTAAGKPRTGTGGQQGGSSRRLGQILKQFELTFDLDGDTGVNVLELLPKEFAGWKKKAQKGKATSLAESEAA